MTDINVADIKTLRVETGLSISKIRTALGQAWMFAGTGIEMTVGEAVTAFSAKLGEPVRVGHADKVEVGKDLNAPN